jgi:hypothetical protein
VERIMKVVKDLATSLRELGIPVLILLMLVCPEWLGNRVSLTGLKRFTNATLDWETPVERSREKTADAGQSVDTTRQALDGALKQIADLIPTANPDLKRSLDQLHAQLQASLSTAQSASQALADSAQLQNQILPSPPASQNERGTWAVVISADKALDPANWEVHRAKLQGYQQVAVYERKNFLRAAVRFDSKSAADGELQNIRTNLRNSSYVVNFDTWCESPQAQKDGTFRCNDGE